MRGNIIEELYYGNLDPQDRGYRPKSPVKKASDSLNNLEENKNFVKINNKETLAQIFTDIRYTRKDNEAMSNTLIQTLERQGFLPHTIQLQKI